MDADHDLDEQIDAAYHTTYRRYSASLINYMVRPEARSTTLKLIPR